MADITAEVRAGVQPRPHVLLAIGWQGVGAAIRIDLQTARQLASRLISAIHKAERLAKEQVDLGG